MDIDKKLNQLYEKLTRMSEFEISLEDGAEVAVFEEGRCRISYTRKVEGPKVHYELSYNNKIVYVDLFNEGITKTWDYSAKRYQNKGARKIKGITFKKYLEEFQELSKRYGSCIWRKKCSNFAVSGSGRVRRLTGMFR